MTTTTGRAALPLAAALLALALTGCKDDSVQSAQDAAKGAAQNAGNQAQQKAYEGVTIAALAAINHNLTSNPQNALVQAKAVCLVLENKNANQAAVEARKRFSTRSVKVNDAMAKQIVRVLKKDLCPKL
jgi:hypothetical protein